MLGPTDTTASRWGWPAALPRADSTASTVLASKTPACPLESMVNPRSMSPTTRAAKGGLVKCTACWAC